MKTYKYTDITNTVVHVIDEDGISRMSMLASVLPEGNVPEPADIPPPPTYQELRAAEYPPLLDLIDGLVKDDAAQIQAYKDACLAVKAKYPK